VNSILMGVLIVSGLLVLVPSVAVIGSARVAYYAPEDWVGVHRFRERIVVATNIGTGIGQAASGCTTC